MAGIGVRLNKIFEKRSILANLTGMAYSAVVTIAPMVLIILTIFLLSYILGFDNLPYLTREIFSCSVLYIFIFGLVFTAPLNAVMSRYMSDVVFDERYDAVMPAYYMGLLINVIIAAVPAIPFFIHEYVAGRVDPVFILMTAFGYFCLVWTFYTMLYLSIVKDYSKVTLFYFIGMAVMFVVSIVLVMFIGVSVTYGMMFGLDMGLLLIASLEFAQLRGYFTESNRKYTDVLPYFRVYWGLIVANTCYIVGMYAHNFVYWTTDLRMVVAKSFVCAQPYDMATFIAMVTNLSATVIFISNVEMNFHKYYKNYSESVIGGRLIDIENAQDHMFMQLSNQLMSLVRVQFIITVVLYLVFSVVLPLIGISGLIMEIYPALAAGYFVLFIMYGAIIFLYYYNDNLGAMVTSATFMVATVVFSFVFSHMDYIWYGMGVLVGSFIGWTVAYFRLRWVEKHLETHIFCKGSILRKGRGRRPSDVVYKNEKRQAEEQPSAGEA
ncbi:MAG: exopolysaccharide Pel transporter PelG [Eubacterium sp.]|nr:exopolysaccharide Pel transporter PelG [Eubacterium sp.]